MARYTGPAFKKSRRHGFSTLECGKELRKRTSAPGQHGTSRKKLSEYGIQLAEKQKVRIMYGLTEKQFKKTFEAAGKKKGMHGTNLLIMLESRLDNIVYRMGLSKTRRSARQIVNHGHILVNGKSVDIPSYQVKPGDIISVKESSINHPVINECLESKLSNVSFVTFDAKKKEGTYVRYPEREELNAEINESLIVEYYNR